MNKVPRWVFRYVGNKTFDFSSKKKDFLPKNDQIWPRTGIFGQFGPGHAGLFSALLVGRLVVVARGLYLTRHLFTLFFSKWCREMTFICPSRRGGEGVADNQFGEQRVSRNLIRAHCQGWSSAAVGGGGWGLRVWEDRGAGSRLGWRKGGAEMFFEAWKCH